VSKISLILGIVVVVIAAVVIYRYTGSASPEPVVEETPPPTLVIEEPEPEPVPPPSVEAREPVDGETRAEPRPPLPETVAEADALLRDQLGDEVEPALREVLDYDYLLGKIVTAADLIYREKNPISQLPFLRRSDRLMVERKGAELYLSEQNYTRYTKWVDTLENLDVAVLADTQDYLSPLLGTAFEELGIVDRDWATTKTETLDYLIGLEVPETPPKLVQAGDLYIYADPELEALPPTHKAFIRMGPDNARRVQAKLREIRDAL